MNGDDGTDRVLRRGEAWELGLNGDYKSALAIIEQLLVESPTDLVALRMKGNLLELQTLDILEYSSRKLITSREYLAARKCYEQILNIDPQNTLALIDLGDHYKNLDAYDRAFSYYEQAISLLASTRKNPTLTEEIENLLGTFLDLSRNKETAERARDLKVTCEKLLNKQ